MENLDYVDNSVINVAVTVPFCFLWEPLGYHLSIVNLVKMNKGKHFVFKYR